MAESLYQVQLTGNVLAQLDAIKGLLTWPEAASEYDQLLTDFRAQIIPNLAQFPLIGKRYLDQAPQSAEALAQLKQLPPGVADTLRVYLHDDYLILYVLDAVKLTAYLLTIRHHSHLSFDFARIWPGSAA